MELFTIFSFLKLGNMQKFRCEYTTKSGRYDGCILFTTTEAAARRYLMETYPGCIIHLIEPTI